MIKVEKNAEAAMPVNELFRHNDLENHTKPPYG